MMLGQRRVTLCGLRFYRGASIEALLCRRVMRADIRCRASITHTASVGQGLSLSLTLIM